ncbi:hypothetical protein BX666DRAFT_1968030 [Dichotomocladium elegans]|nr:hypothetical protein BX666DRAFT_1968030 [Dichotomocladium elegans]
MPSGVRKGHGRRGRPKKILRGRQPSKDTDRGAILATHTLSSLGPHLSDTTNSNPPNKPREERSYKDFYPNLNIRDPIIIVDEQDSTDAQSVIVPSSSPPLSSPSLPPEANMSCHDLPKDTQLVSSDELDVVSSEELSSISVVGDEDEPPLQQNGDNDNNSEESVREQPRRETPPSPLSQQQQQKRIVDHQKEGDLYQALSTRPQQYGVDSVDLSRLPKPSFRIITEDDRHENNSGSDTEDSNTDGNVAAQHRRFQRPENHYIRYIEPSEADLLDTVEYDMDEHDEAWLNILNEERGKDNLGEVSCDLFEAVIDQLEKEWFDLIKNLPKQLADEPSLPEDSACAICDDTECENSNAIVFCDGCNLAVHQDCYGIPYIPEGQWLCRKCLVSPENPVSCIFCPNEGGAFKQTNTNKWGHLLCAIWIPEVGLSNSVYMEPIDNIESVPKSRWKLQCYICRRKHGACIQCDNKHCFVAFHVTCARWARLCMRMKSHSAHYDGVVFKAYCDKHTPRDYKEQVNVEQTVANAQAFFSNNHHHSKGVNRTPRQRYVDTEISLEDRLSSDSDEGSSSKKQMKKRRREGSSGHAITVTQLLPGSKAARAHQHHYSAGAPIAPQYIINKLENLRCVRQATQLRKKTQLITSICRYWSLKRESRRGAPLLKRLHLEVIFFCVLSLPEFTALNMQQPWTASSSQHKQTEVEKAHRAKAMMNLRADLEKVRMLSEQVQKREKLKLERIRKQKAYLETILFPVEYVMKPVVDQLIEADKKELFRYPVTPDVAPDYTDIISTPMSFADILERFGVHEYTSLEQVEHDIMLIWKNSIIYNKPETTYYRTAERLQKLSKELIAQARLDYGSLELKKETGILAIDIHPEIFTYNTIHIPTPEEIAAEKERVAAEERARAEEEERRKQAALKEEARQAAQAARQQARAAAVEAKRIRRIEMAARREKGRQEAAAAKARAALNAAAEAEKKGKEQDEQAKKKMMITRSAQASGKAVETTIPSQPPPTSDKKQRVSSKETPILRRKTRSMGSEGLIAPTAKQLQKRSSNEARKLLWHSDEVQENVEAKPDRKRKAPPGWLYIENGSDSDQTIEEEAEVPAKKPRGTDVRSSNKHPHPKPEPIPSIEPGMIVWARVKGFPPHPAMVVNMTRTNVTKNVLAVRHPNDAVLVEFYEVPDKHKWGWISKSDIFEFGNVDQDTEMLLMARKTKNPRRIKESREGYQRACGLLKLDPSAALEGSLPHRTGKK